MWGRIELCCRDLFLFARAVYHQEKPVGVNADLFDPITDQKSCCLAQCPRFIVGTIKTSTGLLGGNGAISIEHSFVRTG
jgi:hypothetical protein